MTQPDAATSPGILDPEVCERARLARDARFDGRFFIAVLSTGIYCRPICPSRTARRENVRFFRSADEAVAAGFRACLRCRPEAPPGSPAWRGTSATVGRALRLIGEGVLQGQSVASLSLRLGISARHLSRLFFGHVGASPTSIASTWRLNRASRLLVESDRPMSRIALEAGFRTVRRFNDAVRRSCGRTPSQVRRESWGERHAPQEPFTLRLPGRFGDWEAAASFLAARAIPGVEEVTSGVFRRSFRQDALPGVVEVRYEDGSPSLAVRVWVSEPPSLLPVVTRLRAMFDESFGLPPGKARARAGAPRTPGAWDRFELSVQAILRRETSPAHAAALAGRLAKAYGEPLSVPGRGRLALVFPAPEALANARLEGLPPARLRAIRSLAGAVASGRLDPSASDEEFLASLARVSGIRPSTVRDVARRCSGHPETAQREAFGELSGAASRATFPGSDRVLRADDRGTDDRGVTRAAAR